MGAVDPVRRPIPPSSTSGRTNTATGRNTNTRNPERVSGGQSRTSRGLMSIFSRNRRANELPQITNTTLSTNSQNENSNTVEEAMVTPRRHSYIHSGISVPIFRIKSI